MSRVSLLFDSVNVSVAVGNELQKFVSVVAGLPSQFSDLLIVLRDPGVLEHVLKTYPVSAVLCQEPYKFKLIL